MRQPFDHCPLPIQDSLSASIRPSEATFLATFTAPRVYSLTPNTRSIAIKIRFSRVFLPTCIRLGRRLVECSLSNFRGPSLPAITLKYWRLALNWAAALYQRG